MIRISEALDEPELVYEPSQPLHEAANAQAGAVLGIIKGPHFFPEGESRNERYYPRDVWDSVLDDEKVQRRLRHGQILGTIGHDAEINEATIRDEDIATHYTSKMFIDDGVNNAMVGYAECKVINSAKGKILDRLLRAGVKLFPSSRADGDYKPGVYHRGMPVVDKNGFEFERFDYVFDPGFEGADGEYKPVLEAKAFDAMKESLDKPAAALWESFVERADCTEAAKNQKKSGGEKTATDVKADKSSKDTFGALQFPRAGGDKPSKQAQQMRRAMKLVRDHIPDRYDDSLKDVDERQGDDDMSEFKEMFTEEQKKRSALETKLAEAKTLTEQKDKELAEMKQDLEETYSELSRLRNEASQFSRLGKPSEVSRIAEKIGNAREIQEAMRVADKNQRALKSLTEALTASFPNEQPTAVANTVSTFVESVGIKNLKGFTEIMRELRDWRNLADSPQQCAEALEMATNTIEENKRQATQSEAKRLSGQYGTDARVVESMLSRGIEPKQIESLLAHTVSPEQQNSFNEHLFPDRAGGVGHDYDSRIPGNMRERYESQTESSAGKSHTAAGKFMERFGPKFSKAQD